MTNTPIEGLALLETLARSERPLGVTDLADRTIGVRRRPG
jgi:hypothetical protein